MASGGGHRTEEREESERRGGAHGVQPVACTLGVDDRALEVGRRVLVAIHGDVAHEAQPGGQPFVVIELLELGDQRLDRGLERGDVGVGLGVPHGDAQLREPSPRGGTAVAGGPRESHGLRAVAVARRSSPWLSSAPARATSTVARSVSDARATARSSSRAAAGSSRTAARRPARTRLADARAAKCGRGRLACAELATEEHGALEVVAEQFVGGRAVRPVLLEPVGEALVQRGARSFGIPS